MFFAVDRSLNIVEGLPVQQTLDLIFLAIEGDGEVIATRAWTDLVISPERGVHVIDSLLTGFHEPKASHLAMLEAIAGRCHLESAYAAALEGKYLWHEFGDLHLILSS